MGSFSGGCLVLSIVFVISMSVKADGNDQCVANITTIRPGSETGGLSIIYDLGVDFIDSVVTYTIGDLIKDNNIQEFEDFDDDFVAKWKEWAKEYIGLAACIATGVLFVVFIPLIGLCYCCCRCCCTSCCGCCRVKSPGKTSGCKRVSCGFTLFLFTTMMLLSGLCVFLTQEEVSKELYGKEDGLFPDVSTSVSKLGGFVNDSLNTIEEVALHDLSDTARDTLAMISNIPGTTVDTLNNRTGVEDLLDSLQTAVYYLPPLQGNLTLMINSTGHLSSIQSDLDQRLEESRNDINTTLQLCLNSEAEPVRIECQTLLDELPNLKSDANFSTIDTTSTVVACSVITTALDNDVLEITDKAIEGLDNFTKAIENALNETINDAEKSLDEIIDDLNEEWDKLTESIREINLTEINVMINDAQKIVIDYSEEYYTWFYTGVVVVLGIIAGFNYLGLCFGAICKKPRERSGCCTTRLGACCLLTSIAFIFILAWLLMLITLVFFIVGGTTQFLVCRHLVCYDKSMQSIETVTFNSLDVNYNISIRESLEKCQEDAALYDAMNLKENGFDIDDILDLSKTGIYDLVDDVKKIDVDIGTVILVPDGLNDTLVPINEVLSQINFTTYTEQLYKEIVGIDVSELEFRLRNISEMVADDTLKGKLVTNADDIRNISDTIIADMESEKESLSQGVNGAEAIVKTYPDLSVLINDLSNAEVIINAEGNDMIRGIINTTADDALLNVEDSVNYVQGIVKTELARCRPLYDTFTVVTQAVCVYFLYPFNSFWFCLGWFLACCVFTLFFGSMMAAYYRQVQPDDVIVHPFGEYDYEDEAPPPARRTDHIRPGVKTPRKSSASSHRDPPPDYQLAMEMHKKEAKKLDKERKKQAKQIEKELKKKSKVYDQTQV